MKKNILTKILPAAVFTTATPLTFALSSCSKGPNNYDGLLEWNETLSSYIKENVNIEDKPSRLYTFRLILEFAYPSGSIPKGFSTFYLYSPTSKQNLKLKNYFVVKQNGEDVTREWSLNSTTNPTALIKTGSFEQKAEDEYLITLASFDSCSSSWAVAKE